MKRYHTLALRELFAQKMTSFLILIAMVLSTMMTAAVGQSAGVLAAMREQGFKLQMERQDGGWWAMLFQLD